MMLGLLLARAGVEVAVLEKHADFLRDFRGDTVHPSTLDVMYELGLLEEFLAHPHQEVRELAGEIGDTTVTIADFSHLPTRCQFLALMPQWDFLDLLSAAARRLPAFHLRMQTEVTGLLVRGRPHRRRRGEEAGGPAGNQRRAGGRLRRPPLDGARARGAGECRPRIADGRAVDAAREARRRSAAHVRPRPCRADTRDARSRRLLAVRAA